MNKIIPAALVALAASSLFIWYRAHQNPNKNLSVAESKVLIVGTNAEYAPFSFMKNDEIVGFDIDLIHEIGKRLGKTIDLHDMPFDALIPAMQVGSIQIIAAGITPTPEREKRMLFTKPHLTGDQLLIISPATKPINSIDELTGKNVAVNEGFTADYYMSAIAGPELLRLATIVESFLALQSHRADAIVASSNSVKQIMDQFGKQNFHIWPIQGTSDSYALAISKHYPDLLAPAQKALDDMQAEGILDQLKEKWGLS